MMLQNCSNRPEVGWYWSRVQIDVAVLPIESYRPSLEIGSASVKERGRLTKADRTYTNEWTRKAFLRNPSTCQRGCHRSFTGRMDLCPSVSAQYSNAPGGSVRKDILSNSPNACCCKTVQTDPKWVGIGHAFK